MSAEPNFRYSTGMRPSETLSRLRDEEHAIIRRHRARNPRLFGTVARGQDSSTSDLDIQIDPDPGKPDLRPL